MTAWSMVPALPREGDLHVFILLSIYGAFRLLIKEEYMPGELL